MTKKNKYKIATFSGGCFWCTEYDFSKKRGIIKVIAGYAGGKEKNPNYKEVSSGKTGHRESVQLIYDPKKIKYEELLDLFWKSIDPTDKNGQFVDRGNQYTTAIYYIDKEQKRLAEESKKELEKIGKYNKPIVTKILKFRNFYGAEEYHQNFYKKNPIRYNFYKKMSGRNELLSNIKKKFNKELTPIQFRITQEGETEPAFNNEYWDNKKDGIYVDIVSDEPLFSSKDKYDSGTGWPSFSKPLIDRNIIKKKDYKLIFPRTEVRSKKGDNHLGHLFSDGPKNRGGKRYCINSASLKFIPKDKLKEEGYGKFLDLFNK